MCGGEAVRRIRRKALRGPAAVICGLEEAALSRKYSGLKDSRLTIESISSQPHGHLSKPGTTPRGAQLRAKATLAVLRRAGC
jgi:hypothetical protein